MAVVKKSVETELEAVVCRFVYKRKYGVCLVASTLLRHRLDHDGEVIQGYRIFDSVHCYVRHYWFRIDGKDYDVGTIIDTRLKIDLPPSRFSQAVPSQSCYTYVSALDQEELTTLEKGYQLYLTNPKAFWKCSRMNWLKKLVL